MSATMNNAADVVLTWKKQRTSYPGWLVAPDRARQTIWRDTQHYGRLLLGTEEASPLLRLAGLAELAWRFETALTPLVPQLADAIQEVREAFVDHADDNSEAGRQLGYVTLQLLRYRREGGDWDGFQQLLAAVESLHHIDQEFRVEILNERVLAAMAQFDIALAQQLLSEWAKHEREQDPSADLLLASRLAEIGDLTGATAIAERTLARARERSAGNEGSFRLLSIEGWTLLLLEAIHWASANLPPSPPWAHFRRLAEYRCDPTEDLYLLDAKLGQLPREPDGQGPQDTFDPDVRVIQTALTSPLQQSFDSISRLQPAFQVFRLSEIAPLVGSTDLIEMAAEWLRSSGSAMPLAACNRFANTSLLNSFLDRYEVAGLRQVEFDKLHTQVSNYLSGQARISERVGIHNTSRDGYALELFSRLNIRGRRRKAKEGI